MRQLLEGHASFRREYAAGAREFLATLASEHQSPSALYVGCADSRVVPELLTSSSPGELFVVRNIANAVPPLVAKDASVGAALDYAVGVLKVGHIVVCGHYGCGGVKAVIDDHVAARKMPSLAEWLGGLAPAIREVLNPHLDAEEQWRLAVEANVLAQMANLPTYGVVREALDAGTLQLHAWVYDLHSAGLAVFDMAGERFVAAESLSS